MTTDIEDKLARLLAGETITTNDEELDQLEPLAREKGAVIEYREAFEAWIRED